MIVTPFGSLTPAQQAKLLRLLFLVVTDKCIGDPAINITKQQRTAMQSAVQAAISDVQNNIAPPAPVPDLSRIKLQATPNGNIWFTIRSSHIDAEAIDRVALVAEFNKVTSNKTELESKLRTEQEIKQEIQDALDNGVPFIELGTLAMKLQGENEGITDQINSLENQLTALQKIIDRLV